MMAGEERRTEHGAAREEEGRPVGQAIQDAQRARRSDVFKQPDGRYVVRGGNGREHIIEPNGKILTSLNRSDAAHRAKINDEERTPATEEEYNRLKDLVR